MLCFSKKHTYLQTLRRDAPNKIVFPVFKKCFPRLYIGLVGWSVGWLVGLVAAIWHIQDLGLVGWLAHIKGQGPVGWLVGLVAAIWHLQDMGQLVGWLAHINGQGPVGWLVGCYMGHTKHGPVGRLVGWLVGWLVASRRAAMRRASLLRGQARPLAEPHPA